MFIHKHVWKSGAACKAIDITVFTHKTCFYDAWFYVQKYPTGKFSFHILWPFQEYNILGYFATWRRRIPNFQCVQPEGEGRERRGRARAERERGRAGAGRERGKALANKEGRDTGKEGEGGHGDEGREGGYGEGGREGGHREKRGGRRSH